MLGLGGDYASSVAASSRFCLRVDGDAAGRVGNLAASTTMGMCTFAFVFDGSGPGWLGRVDAGYPVAWREEGWRYGVPGDVW